MTQWRVEFTSVTSDTLTEDQREALALALPGFAVLTDDEATRHIIVTFDVEAPTHREAVSKASKALTGAAREVLGSPIPFLGIAAARGDAPQKRVVPELVGYIEIAAILAAAKKDTDKPTLSRQRARQIAEEHPDFPAPAARLAMGPVFTLESVLEFAKNWTGKTGRPRVSE